MEAFWVDNPPESVTAPVALRAPETILNTGSSPAIDIWSFGCLMFELLTNYPLFEAPFWYEKDLVDDGHLIQITQIISPLPESMLERWPRHSSYFGPGGERLSTNPSDFEDTETVGDSEEDKWEVLDIPLGNPEEENPKFVESGSDKISHDKSEETMDYDDSEVEQIGEDVSDDWGNDDLENVPPSEPLGPLEDRFRERKPKEMGDEEAEEIVSLLRVILRIDPLERPSAADLLARPWFTV